jgi:hypothetical protein
VVVTAYCGGKGGSRHNLAQLVATPGGLQVYIRRHPEGHAKGNRVVNRRGGPLVAPLLDVDGEPSMTYLAMCAHGVHAVYARDLARAADTRVREITLAAVLLLACR